MVAEALPFQESDPSDEVRVVLSLVPELEEPEPLYAVLLRDGRESVIYHGDGFGRYDMSGQFFTARAWAAYKSNR